ncbi:unnamed protein product, partial [Mesorhabditis spiculigera]
MTGSLVNIYKSHVPTSNVEYVYYEYDIGDGGCHSPGSPWLEKWVELPQDRDPKLDTYAALIFFIFGVIGFPLSLYAFYVIYRKKELSFGSRLFLLFVCYIRATESLFDGFKVHCIITWWCINVENSPFSGFVFNNLITSYHIGVSDTVRFLSAGLTVNRDEATGHICRGGYWFSVGELMMVYEPGWNPEFFPIMQYSSTFIGYVYWATFAVDLTTLWKIRRMMMVDWFSNIWRLAFPWLMSLPDWTHISIIRIMTNDGFLAFERIFQM